MKVLFYRLGIEIRGLSLFFYLEVALLKSRPLYGAQYLFIIEMEDRSQSVYKMFSLAGSQW